MVAGTIEKIQVVLQAVTRGFVKGMNNVNKSMKGVNTKLNTQTALMAKQNVQITKAPLAHQKAIAGFVKRGKAMHKLTKINTENLNMNRVAQQGFFKTMRMGQPEFKKFNEQGRQFTTAGGRIANSFRKSMHGMRGFRMEMLGVMFFGMMLQKTFSGLIKTSLDWMGVMDVFSVALGVLFLPVAGLLLEWALKFLQWVSTATPEQKKLIGTFVLMGIAIGGLLYLIGTFTLGIGSLILAFKFLFSPIGAILGILLALAGISIYGMFDGLFEEVDGAGEKIAGFGITGETLVMVKDKIMGVITKVKDTIVENFPAILEKGKEILDKIIDGLVENKEKIANAMEKIIEAIGTWIGDNSDKLLSLGLAIAKGIISGIIKGLLKLGWGIGEAAASAITGLPKEVFREFPGFPEYQHGGIVPNTGLAMLHAGENVIPKNKVGGGGRDIILNVTYDINVSDPEEMERLIRENNSQLVEEVKRQIAI